MTRSTADLVCAGHSGAWVAELDHPGDDDDDHDDNDDAGVDDDDTLGPGLQSWIIQVGFELTICGALSRITNSEHPKDPFIVM